MALALLIAVAPVLLGASFALVPGLGPRWTGLVRTAALGAALGVVALGLLPGALASLGLLALPLFAAGLMVPMALERLGGALALHPRVHALGVELAFLGLCVHQLVDGLAVGGASGWEQGAGTVGLAIAAHTTPLVAATTLGYAGHDGLRSALGRVGVLAGVTAAGVVLGALSVGWTVEWAEPALKAALAGLLLHTLGHGLYDELPRGSATLLTDLVAAVVGLAVPVVALGGMNAGLLDATGALAELISPALLIGLVVSAALARFGREDSHRPTWRLQQAGAGVYDALFRPLEAAVVLRWSGQRLDAGVPWPRVLAGLLVGAELRAETVLVAAVLLGPVFAALWAFGTVALAVAAGVVVGWLTPARPEDAAPFPRAQRQPGLREALAELALHGGPWAALGVLLAGLVMVHLGPDALPALGGGVRARLLAAAVALPCLVSPLLSLPLVAVLIHQGLPSGAALVALLLGGLVHPLSMGWVAERAGPRALAGVLGVLVCGALALGAGLDAVATAAPWVRASLEPGLLFRARLGPLPALCTLVAGGLLLAGLARVGLRAWLGLLTQGPDAEGHPHPHDPAHDPEHTHAHAHDHTHDPGHR